MKEYYKQIKRLTAIALIAFAVLLIFACFLPGGKIRLNNKPAKAITTEKSQLAAKAQTSEKADKTSKTYKSSGSGKNYSKSTTTEAFDDFPININTADAETLMNIPHIGQAKANEIVAYRNANGNFTSAEDLLNVYGISETTLEQIYGYITV